MNAQVAAAPVQTNEINDMVQTLKVVKTSVKPKRKTKAKAKTVKAKAPAKTRTKRSPVPRTARAYMKTLGYEFDKESVAVTELVKLHHSMNKPSQEPAIAIPDPAMNTYVFTKPGEPVAEPLSLWQRFIKWLAR